MRKEAQLWQRKPEQRPAEDRGSGGSENKDRHEGHRRSHDACARPVDALDPGQVEFFGVGARVPEGLMGGLAGVGNVAPHHCHRIADGISPGLAQAQGEDEVVDPGLGGLGGAHGLVRLSRSVEVGTWSSLFLEAMVFKVPRSGKSGL